MPDLKELFDAGMLTWQEFGEQKKKILARADLHIIFDSPATRRAMQMLMNVVPSE